MKRDALQQPTQVRLPADLKARLSTAAEQFGLTASELIRRAIEYKLPDWEQSGVLQIKAHDPTRTVRRMATAAIVAAALAIGGQSIVTDPQSGADAHPMVCAGD